MAACRKCTLVVQVRLLVSGFLLHSSNGSGRLPFGQKIRVRFPYGVLFQTLTVSGSNVQCIMYDVKSIMYDVKSTMYDVKSIMYNVKSTMYDVQC